MLNEFYEVLGRLSYGKTLWFWLADELLPGEPCLLLRDRDDDPQGMSFRHEVQLWSRALPEDTDTCAGSVQVAPDGSLRFCSVQEDLGQLVGLVEWVAENRDRAPELARLRGAAFFVQEGERLVPSEWSTQAASAPLAHDGLSVGQSNRLDMAVSALRALAPGEAAWAWFSPCSFEDAPVLMVAPQKDDPSGEDFRARIRRAQGASGRHGAGQAALIRRKPSGKLVLKPLSEGGALRAWLASNAARAEELAQLAAGRAELPAHLQDLHRKLQAADMGDRFQFWFTPDAGSSPALVLAAPGQDLRAEVKKVIAQRPRVRPIKGQATLSPKGILMFRACSEAPAFLPALADLFRHRGRAPGLARLRGSRVKITDADGNTVHRYADDSLWTETR